MIVTFHPNTPYTIYNSPERWIHGNDGDLPPFTGPNAAPKPTESAERLVGPPCFALGGSMTTTKKSEYQRWMIEIKRRRHWTHKKANNQKQTPK